MLRTIALGLALAAMPVQSGAQPAAAQEDIAPSQLETRAADVVAVLRGEKPAAEVFSSTFLAAVPETQLRALTGQLTGQFGALQGVESVAPTGPKAATVTFRFERATGSGPMQLDAEGLVAGLALNQFQPIDDSAEKIAADLAALPGEASVYYGTLAPGEEAIIAVDADEQFAIGSTFKLYILAALARQIAAGEHRWDEVVALDTRSLPSGLMQEWPEGAPVTLHTLATLMISISDNTATDQLLAIVGREAVAEEMRASGHAAPERTLPLLSTLELFALKGDPAQAQAYAAADEAGQARMLAALRQEIGGDPANITPPDFSAPVAIDSIEWFASGRDLAGLLRVIAELDDPTAREIMAVSPALPAAERRNWSYVGFKGGSEPGVLNLTWLLRDTAGEWRVLTMSWNDPAAAVASPTLELIAQRILALPAD